MSKIENDLADLIGEAAPPALRLVPEAPAPLSAAALQFERCRPWLEEALSGGHHTMDDVAREIASQSAQFWPGKACAVVTRVHTFPTSKACQVWLAGGDMAEILTLQAGLEAWARLMGCTEVLIEGRRGWERVMKPAGFELAAVCLRKAL